VPRHVARLVKRLVDDYFASRRLVVNYFTYAARRVASTRRRACHDSSSSISPTSRFRVPLHIARLVTRLVTRLVIDYSA
jgi:hypothetical protein